MWIRQKNKHRGVDGTKLDIAGDSVNIIANQKERRKENHCKSKSTWAPTEETIKMTYWGFDSPLNAYFFLLVFSPQEVQLSLSVAA